MLKITFKNLEITKVKGNGKEVAHYGCAAKKFFQYLSSRKGLIIALYAVFDHLTVDILLH